MKAERISRLQQLIATSLMKVRSQKQGHSKIVFLRQSLVAAALVVSLLSALVPFSAASSAHLCTMEYCAGTAPHLAGTCSTSLMKKAPKVTYEPEVLCGLHLESASHLTAVQQVPRELSNAGAGDRDSSHAGSCGGHQVDAADQSARSETITSKVPVPASIAAPLMTSPCGADCGTCSGGYVRQPRPRDQAVAWGVRARPPSHSRFLRSLSHQTATLPGHYERPQPRGPPTSLS